MKANDIITEDGIKKYIKSSHKIIVFDDITSTNDELKRLAAEGAKEGTVVVSDHQSSGKGRRGRSFFSPKYSGIYMSLLFRPDERKTADIIKLTSYAAVAVSCAISDVCEVETGIKWVNDIYIGDKKICGILAEAVTDSPETIGTVIVGIGINVYEPPDIPDDIKDIAGYIYPLNIRINDIRNRIVAAVIDNLYSYYNSSDDHEIMNCYRTRSIVLGRRIAYGPNLEHTGLAKSIDDSGALIVEGPQKEEVTLRTGEISLRILQ